MHLKLEILGVIYDVFDRWAAEHKQACNKGCASCCTRNITITGLEGELILNHAVENGMQEAVGSILGNDHALNRPVRTINAFAAECLDGKEPQEEEDPKDLGPCPFLENNRCTIYPVRPFGCRSFLSQHVCAPGKPALMTESYFTACTVVNQLIEHLGQREYYGNLLDVLGGMLDSSTYQAILEAAGDKTVIHRCREHLLTARPLPGFLLTHEDSEAVAPLIEEIFNTVVDDKRIEDILNGR